MALLLIGVLLFAGVHLIPSLAPGLKTAWVARLGENGYKGTFSLLLLLGLGLIVLGWRGSQPAYLYTPPVALQLPALLLVCLGLLLFVISNRESRLRQFIRHPQLTGVLLWGIAHLMLNGDSRSLVLFAGLSLWALAEIPAINRREGVWIKGGVPGWGTELASVLIAAVVVAVVIALHPYIAGVPVR